MYFLRLYKEIFAKLQDLLDMDMTRVDIMRIPFATVLFLSSVFLLWNYFNKFNGDLLTTIGGVACICMLVYSMVLYSNLDVPAFKH